MSVHESSFSIKRGFTFHCVRQTDIGYPYKQGNHPRNGRIWLVRRIKDDEGHYKRANHCERVHHSSSITPQTCYEWIRQTPNDRGDDGIGGNVGFLSSQQEMNVP